MRPIMGRSTILLATLALGLGALLASCTSDAPAVLESSPTAAVSPTSTLPAEEPAPPTPSPTPRVPEGFPVEAPAPDYAGIGLVDGLPPDAVGPLVVYAPVNIGASDPEVTVTLFDAGAGIELAKTTFASSSSVAPFVVGDRLVVSFSRSLWSYALDGSDGRELLAGPRLAAWTVTSSPNGRHIALTVFDDDRSRLVILDSTEGSIEFELPSDDPRLTDVGEVTPQPTAWLDAETLGFALADSPESLGGTGTVSLDGDVSISPEDRAAALRAGALRVRHIGRLSRECGLAGYAGATGYELIDRDGRVVAAVDTGAPLLGFPEVAPDSTEPLYGEFAPSPEVRAALIEVERGAGCVPAVGDDSLEHEALSAPFGWHLLDVQSGEDRVVDQLAVWSQWHGSRAVTFVCGDEELPGDSYGGGRWGTPRNAAPYGPPFGFSGPECAGTAGRVELRVGGTPVAQAASLAVFGIVEVP